MADCLGVDKMPRYSHSTATEHTSCTVALSGGRFCDATAAPDMPFPICAPHAIRLYRRMSEMVTEVSENRQQYMDIHYAAIEGMVDERHARDNTAQHKVYYVRCGDLIKIGTTRKLASRMNAYPPDAELLAVEPGGEALETERLVQFDELLAHRKEWFHPGPDLMDHIATIREQHPTLAA